MKTLHQHVIVYDQECPLCQAYTGVFVKSGMLATDGRLPFHELKAESYPQLDVARSRDEIALIDQTTGRVTYGIDSLFTIIGNSFPVLKPLFHLKSFHLTVRHLYFFISYNRKVIAPAPVFESEKSCTPTFNSTYRWAYIIFSWIFTSLVLSRYVTLLAPIVPTTLFFREWLVCGGQIVFQAVVVAFTRKEKLLLHYLGNMMTVSNIGALALLPAFLIPVHQPVFFLLWFGCVVSYMLIEHARRTTILGLPATVTLSWVIYRVLVLTSILFA